MNTRDFAKKHGKSPEWVRERCSEDLLPLAKKKKNGRWDIPEDSELPPCTGREAALILENIIERNRGIEVCIIPARMAKRGEAALNYLLNWGFIAASSENGGVSLTTRGTDLLNGLRGAKKSAPKKRKTSFEAGGSLGFENGSVRAIAEAKYRVETEEAGEAEDSTDKRAG